LEVLGGTETKIRLKVLEPKRGREPMTKDKVHRRSDLRRDHCGVLGGKKECAQVAATQDGKKSVTECVCHMSGKIPMGVAAHDDRIHLVLYKSINKDGE
jgi:hypothetical protein